MGWEMALLAIALMLTSCSTESGNCIHVLNEYGSRLSDHKVGIMVYLLINLVYQ